MNNLEAKNEKYEEEGIEFVMDLLWEKIIESYPRDKTETIENTSIAPIIDLILKKESCFQRSSLTLNF